MAKALLGYMSATDPRALARLTSENRRLRQQVEDLEAHIIRLQAENDALSAVAQDHPLLTVPEQLSPDQMQPV